MTEKDDADEQIAQLLYEQHRLHFTQPPPPWDELPHEWQRKIWLDRACDILNVANPLFLRALDKIDQQRKEIEALVDDNKALMRDIEEMGHR